MNTHTKKNTELSDSDLDQISGGNPIIGLMFDQKAPVIGAMFGPWPFPYRATRG